MAVEGVAVRVGAGDAQFGGDVATHTQMRLARWPTTSLADGAQYSDGRPQLPDQRRHRWH